MEPTKTSALGTCVLCGRTSNTMQSNEYGQVFACAFHNTETDQINIHNQIIKRMVA